MPVSHPPMLISLFGLLLKEPGRAASLLIPGQRQRTSLIASGYSPPKWAPPSSDRWSLASSRTSLERFGALADLQVSRVSRGFAGPGFALESH